MEDTKQLYLEFTQRSDRYHKDNFIPSSSNLIAFKHLVLDAAPWNSNCTIIVGPPGSGKTHLATIWQRQNNAAMLGIPCIKTVMKQACIIENIDTCKAYRQLLHCFNLSKEYKNKLLLTSKIHPAMLKINLPDLKSRLIASDMIEMQPPDHQLLRVILMKQFIDRHIKVSKAPIEYILSHCERSVSFLEKLVEMIDRASLQNKKNISIQLIKGIIAKINNQ